jgi:formylglycine-generating enzyme required for sulfatase activity/energy-coupling factor transporter ATP-binding protein EcfA2
MSSIFISHSSEDKAWAELIRDWLQGSENKQHPERRYQSLFLDFDPELGIPIGRSWRDTLYEKLQLCRAVIVICSVAYGKSQWCLAELGVAMASGKLVLPVRMEESPQLRLLSETQHTPLQPIDLDADSLEGWQRLERGLAALSWQERLAWPPENEPDASPFPGLGCFERKHAPVFFGQDEAVREAQAKVEALTASASRLLLILGASGCGKSSLLRAGLVPWLAGAEPGRWIVLDPFRPGGKPFRWLAAALQKARGTVADLLDAGLLQTGHQIREQLEELRALKGQQDAKVVIAIDQFEELLGRGEAREEGEATDADIFLTALAELLKLEDSRVLLLASLRSDFLGTLQLHPSRIDSLAGDPILLGPLDVAGFRQVIEGPAQRVGMRLERGLSDLLVRDTPSGDALPLLAFTLRELWDGRTGCGGITIKQYEDFGGLAGAVQRKADEVLSTSGATEEEMASLEMAFIKYLVRLTSDGQEAKQRERLEALPAASRRLVRLFVEARLLVSGKGADGDQVEIAHEALLRTWPKLVGWIEKGREALIQRQRVRRLAEDLSADAPEGQRHQALEQIAALAAAGGSEADAVRREAHQPLVDLLQAAAPVADRKEAALVLALIGAEEPLRLCLANPEAPVALRRRAAESLGLLARRSGERVQRQRIADELEKWLRSDALNLLVLDAEGWAEHDALLPLLQGASRGLQLAASADLPLLGSGPGSVVPMLTLMALEEDSGLRIATELVDVQVWKLPLPGGDQLEMVMVPEGDYQIGSPVTEDGRAAYTQFRSKCDPTEVDVEAQRSVRLRAFAMLRHPISQGQWRAVVEGVAEDKRGNLRHGPGTFRGEDLWERYGQPGGLPVDCVSWDLCGEWLQALNCWLSEQWPTWADLFPAMGGNSVQLVLPSESQWEAACRGDADSPTPFHFGATLDPCWARYNASKTYGKGRRGVDEQRPVANGYFGLVNSHGLAELHGQMLEWCGDKWHRDPVAAAPLEGAAMESPDPGLTGDKEQLHRLVRGGAWYIVPRSCRSSSRNSLNPDRGVSYIGFRPCCPFPPGSLPSARSFGTLPLGC